LTNCCCGRTVHTMPDKASRSPGLAMKQRATVEKLKADNSKLKDELLLENKYSTARSNPAATAQIQKLQDQADVLTRKIEIEKRKVSELDKQIDGMSQKIAEQRKKMGGVHAARENNQQIQKSILILENRLDKALVRYNEALAHNKTLRAQIDNLRRERLVFDQTYRKLERELQEKKKEMAIVIEQSNRAYEARDAAVNEMATLKAQADREQAAFEAEWRELGRLIESDKKMKELMKNRSKEERDNAERRGELTMEEEGKLKKKVVRGNWNIAKDRASQQISMEKVQSYSEAFARIQQATGISDIDELVSTFINAEDENFRFFNYINKLNQEIEKLEEQIGETKAEIEKYKGQGANADTQRKKILKDLEERLAKTEARAEVYEQRQSAAQKTMNALKDGISKIFTRIGCNTPAVREMLGDDGVTEENMMQHLGIIEQRVNEILQMYAASQAASSGQGDGSAVAVASVLGQGPQTPAGQGFIQIEPPSALDDQAVDDESEEEEGDERPLSLDELKAKTLKSIGRRDGSGAGKKAAGGAAKGK